MAVAGRPPRSNYRLLISRSWLRPKAQLYAFGMQQSIPQFPLPLLKGEMEPLIDLNTVVHELYVRARFDLRLDYSLPPEPPLAEDDYQWASEHGIVDY